MVDVAQLVRAPGCGPGGRGFKPHHSPHNIHTIVKRSLFIKKATFLMLTYIYNRA